MPWLRESAIAYFFGITRTSVANYRADIGVLFDESRYLLAAQAHLLLCRDDCAGLCPRCGADLNAGPCACHNPAEPA